jgi:predicted CopG family antitoxin
MYTLFIVVRVARQISVSNEVYELLSRKKGKKSFSQVIKENLTSKEKKVDVMTFARVLKKLQAEA